MSDRNNYHMTPEDFRKHGHELIDWIVDYWKNVEDYPVLSTVSPGEIRSSLPQKAPVEGEAFKDIIKDVNEHIIPGITHWQSPNFFAYFPSNTSGPSVLGELLSAGLGCQGMLWSTSPACTELETHVLDWLVDMLDLPEKFSTHTKGGGVIQDSASSAALCALLAARERVADFMSNEKGCDSHLVVYTSTQAHSSIEKAVKIAGIGRENLRLIGVDDNLAMNPELLKQQIQNDKEAGFIPCFVCATIGTTSTNAIDPVSEIGKICEKENVWLHIDSAMSGTAAICPEFRFINRGIEYADSYCFNPHKWMFTNFDCDCFYVADREVLIKTLSVLPEYLKNKASESGAVIDYRDWQIPLGRRFRALKLWFVIRHYGVEGLQYHIKKHVELAQQFASWIKASEDFELVTIPPLNLVCFRHIAGNSHNENLLHKLNESGKLFLTHTKINNQFVLRFCVGQTHTDDEHVLKAWEQIKDFSKHIGN